jgi:hypothetical protein
MHHPCQRARDPRRATLGACAANRDADSRNESQGQQSALVSTGRPVAQGLQLGAPLLIIAKGEWP